MKRPKFKKGDRVVYTGPRNGGQPCVPIGTLGTVEWHYFGGGGEMRVAWEFRGGMSPWRGVWPEELDWGPVVDALARLG